MSFDFSLQTAIASSIGSSALLAATLYYLWRLFPRQRAQLYWSLAFAMQAGRMCLQLAISSGHAEFLPFANVLLAIVALLIWLGVCALSERTARLPLLFMLLAAALAWEIWSSFTAQSFVVRTLPVYALAAGAMLAAAIALWRIGRERPGTGYRVLALLFAAIGVHYLDHPFLRNVEWFAPIGFAISTALMLMIGLVMLIVTQRSQQIALEAANAALARETAERGAVERQYRTLVDALDEGVLAIDDSGSIITCNPAAARLLAATPEELDRQPIRDYCALFAENGDRLAYEDYPLRRALRGESVPGTTVRLVRRDGSGIWVSVNARPLAAGTAGAPRSAIASLSDVTARKQAEGALLASELRFRSIFEAIPDIAVQGCDSQRRVIYWNAASERFYGYSRAEALVHPIDELLLQGEDAERFRAEFAAGIAAGHMRPPTERAAWRKDGSRILVYSSQVLICNLAGEPEVYNLDIDLSEIRRLQEELQDYSERFRALAESSELGIVVADSLGRFVYCNSRYLAQIDATEAEVRDGSWIEHLHPDDRERMRERWQTAVRTKNGFSMERRVINLDGSVQWASVHVFPVRTAGGDFRGFVATVEDITAHKTAEETLRQSEMRLARIVHYSPAALVITDNKTEVITDFNRAWQEMFGYTREQVIGKTSLEFGLWVDVEDRARLYEALQANNGELDRFECRYRRADGSILHGLASGRMFEIGGQPCYLWSITDITAKHELEARMADLNSELEARVEARTEELQLAQDELLRAEKLAALGALVAGIAHELNTPIGNSVTVASTLHDRTAEFAETITEGTLKRSSLNAYLESARTASDLLLRSLAQARNLVASFKQVAVDQTSDQRRRFDLREVVGEVLTTLSPTLRKTPFDLSIEIPEGIVMDSYPGPLGQVITNFVANALLHAFEGRLTGCIFILATALPDEEVRLVVRDDGNGIPEEHQRRIFDPFFTTKMGRGGTGLGLHIVYNIVTRILGGRIAVDSRVGAGAAFVLTMPLSAPKDEEAPAYTVPDGQRTQS